MAVVSYGSADATRLERTGGKGRAAATLVAALCAFAVAAVVLNGLPAGPVALEYIKDMDAPNAIDEKILVSG